MLYRPLFFLSILLVTVTAVAQLSPFGSLDGNLSPVGIRSTVSGTVRDMTDHGVAGARIELHDIMTGQVVKSTYTFANGSYQMSGVPDGQYELVVYNGLSESRTRVDFPSAGEVNMRIAGQASEADQSAGSANSVSISQMKVPGKARKLFQKAMAAFQAAKLDDAMRFTQKALGMYPDYAKALTLRGVMNMERGDTKSAEPDLQKAVQLDYSDSMSFVALASLYNTEGKYDNALQVLDHGMSVHPNSWQALSEQARAQIGKRQFDDALKSIAQSEHYAPPQATYLHLFRAQALLGIHNVPGAVTEIKTYLAKDPKGQNVAVARKMLNQLDGVETAQAMK